MSLFLILHFPKMTKCNYIMLPLTSFHFSFTLPNRNDNTFLLSSAFAPSPVPHSVANLSNFSTCHTGKTKWRGCHYRHVADIFFPKLLSSFIYSLLVFFSKNNHKFEWHFSMFAGPLCGGILVRRLPGLHGAWMASPSIRLGRLLLIN